MTFQSVHKRRAKKNPFAYGLSPKTDAVSPEEFLELLETDESDIESAEFIPPKLGDKHFGYFLVNRKTKRFAF